MTHQAAHDNDGGLVASVSARAHQHGEEESHHQVPLQQLSIAAEHQAAACMCTQTSAYVR